MFKVQRFTAEDEEGEGGRGRVDHSANILNKVLEKAKARASAKRARLTSSSDGAQHQASTSALPLERKSGTKVALNSAAGGRETTASAVGASKGEQSLTAADSNKGRAGGAAQEKDGGSNDDDGDSSEEEGSSSGESGSEGDEERGDSGEEEKDAEIPPPVEPAGATSQGCSAAGGAGEDQDAGGQGLRPMDEVAEEWGLDSRLAETLREEGVKHFFPIQVCPRYKY